MRNSASCASVSFAENISMHSMALFHITGEDLERLYSVGDNDKTIETIMKCRIEHEQTEIIRRAFWPLIEPRAAASFKLIQDYAQAEWTKRASYGAARIQQILRRVYENAAERCLGEAFRLLSGVNSGQYSKEAIPSSAPISHRRVSSKYSLFALILSKILGTRNTLRISLNRLRES